MKQAKRLLALLLVMAMVMVNVPAPVFAVGSTNADGYIEIRTVEDLYNIRDDLSANYILMNDIDLTEATAKGGLYDNNGAGWKPLGSFTGIFDGNGYSIIGMRIAVKSTSGRFGLFSTVDGGSVKNLGMRDGTITRSSSGYPHVGFIAGHLYSATIENCFNTGNIQLTSLTSRGTDGEQPMAGGLVGCADNATIKNSYNTGNITAQCSSSSYWSYVGGICGSGDNNKITNCYNTGNLSATILDSNGNGGAAGITLCLSSTVSCCYNLGTAKWAIARYGTVSNSYHLSGCATSTVAGTTALTVSQMALQSRFAGFDFVNTWVLEPNALYPYPQLKSNAQDLRVVENITLASGPRKTEYGYGEALDLTGAELKVTYTDGASELVAIQSSMVSGFSSTAPGIQTVEVAYQGFKNTFTVKVNEIEYISVSTIEDLYNIRNDLTANYILVNDIDLTAATAIGGDWDFGGRGWNPIGSKDTYTNGAFSGTFNGNGHKISGMRISIASVPSGTSTCYVGLFANVTGTVKNLSMSGSITFANEYEGCYIGSIAGYASGNIQNCHSTVSITASGLENKTVYVGGLVGYGSGAKISQCSNRGSVFVESTLYNSTTSYEVYVGGIIGYGSSVRIEQTYNTGSVTAKAPNAYYGRAYVYGIGHATNVNCYNTGKLTANKNGDYSRGFTYGIGGDPINCYNVGKCSASDTAYAISSSGTSCYYLSGVGSSGTGCTSLTEAQMKMVSMYKDFDFDQVWVLNAYAQYPYAQLQANAQNLNESVTLVSILALPNKIDYFVGDRLDLTGSIVKVVYASGREEIRMITEDMISAVNMNTAGEKTVTVIVAGTEDTFTIRVIERPAVQEISIVAQPDTKAFTVGTAFDFTGAKALITYEGGITEYKDITVDQTTGGNINHIGKQTITYTVEGKSATFEVEVVGIKLDKIIISSLPNKLTYLEGEALDLTGLAVTAVMSNGLQNSIGTNYTVSGYSTKPGTHTLTVAYLGKTVTFDVTVLQKTLEVLMLVTLPDKVDYISGQPFDARGMRVVGIYDNGDEVEVTDYTISGFDSTPGIKTVVITLDSKSVSFTVQVISRVITNFKLTSAPTKLEYIEFESLNTCGLVAEATYNDGITEEVTDYTLAGFSSTPGTHTVTVAYQGFVESFEIHVTPRILETIKVVPPAKVVYDMGEEFDATGMEVIACYNNGQEIAVNDYQISGMNTTAPGSKIITVTYGGFSNSFVIVVQERFAIQSDGSFTVGTQAARLGEEVRIPVSATSNIGVSGLRHEISFNTSDLKLVGVELQATYASGTLVVNEEQVNDGKITILWFSDTDVKLKGVVYELVFTVEETAADGITEVKIDFADNDHGNVSGENVIFGKQDGSVEVCSWWLGDLNGDRKYAMVDLVMLAQYVAGFEMTMTEKQLLSADVNEDGVIDIHDVVLLNQWLLAEDI